MSRGLPQFGWLSGKLGQSQSLRSQMCFWAKAPPSAACCRYDPQTQNVANMPAHAPARARLLRVEGGRLMHNVGMANVGMAKDG